MNPACVYTWYDSRLNSAVVLGERYTVQYWNLYLSYNRIHFRKTLEEQGNNLYISMIAWETKRWALSPKRILHTYQAAGHAARTCLTVHGDHLQVSGRCGRREQDWRETIGKGLRAFDNTKLAVAGNHFPSPCRRIQARERSGPEGNRRYVGGNV